MAKIMFPHKNLGHEISSIYVAQENRDLTEGRGGMVDKSFWTNRDEAYEAVKGRAVQGCGDGDIVLRSWYRCLDCPMVVTVNKKIYVGDDYSKKNALGRGNYKDFLPDGWHKDFSTLTLDPDWVEYQRLKEKFGD